jgi:hypothetical protein
LALPHPLFGGCFEWLGVLLLSRVLFGVFYVYFFILLLNNSGNPALYFDHFIRYLSLKKQLKITFEKRYCIS